MKLYRLIALSGFSMIVILTGALSVRTQDQTPTVTRSTKRVIRPEGWSIPPVKKGGGSSRITRTILNGIEIKGRVLTPISKVVIYEDFFIRPNGSLIIMRSKHPIVVMSELSVGDKIFAYAVRYAAGLGNVGGVFDVDYVDNDGDGIFEERAHSEGMPLVPEWVKKK